MVLRIFLLIIFLCSASSASAKEQLIFRKSIDWCPYECDPQRADGKQGFIADILETVLGAEYQIRYVDYAFNRSLVEAQNGAIDGVLGVYKSDAPNLILHKVPIGSSENRFFVQKQDPWRFSGTASLHQIRREGWAIFAGYSYPLYQQFIDENPSSITLVNGTSRAQRALQMLILGRIQTLYEDLHVVEYLLDGSLAENGLIDAGGSSTINEVFVAFSPQKPSFSKQLALKLDLGIQRLRLTGQLNNILAKYQVSDWKHAPHPKMARIKQPAAQ